jgi:hypothetical protein
MFHNLTGSDFSVLVDLKIAECLTMEEIVDWIE